MTLGGPEGRRTRMQPADPAQAGEQWLARDRDRPIGPAADAPARSRRSSRRAGPAAAETPAAPGAPEAPAVKRQRGFLRRFGVPVAVVVAAVAIASGVGAELQANHLGGGTAPTPVATAPASPTTTGPGVMPGPSNPPDRPGDFTPATMPATQPSEHGFVPAGQTMRATLQVNKYMVTGGHAANNDQMGWLEVTAGYPENKPQTQMYLCPDQTGPIEVTKIDSRGFVWFDQGGKPGNFVFDLSTGSFIQLLGGSPTGGGPSN